MSQGGLEQDLVQMVIGPFLLGFRSAFSSLSSTLFHSPVPSPARLEDDIDGALACIWTMLPKGKRKQGRRPISAAKMTSIWFPLRLMSAPHVWGLRPGVWKPINSHDRS